VRCACFCNREDQELEVTARPPCFPSRLRLELAARLPEMRLDWDREIGIAGPCSGCCCSGSRSEEADGAPAQPVTPCSHARRSRLLAHKQPRARARPPKNAAPPNSHAPGSCCISCRPPPASSGSRVRRECSLVRKASIVWTSSSVEKYGQSGWTIGDPRSPRPPLAAVGSHAGM
jgi:hypothetical protein